MSEFLSFYKNYIEELKTTLDLISLIDTKNIFKMIKDSYEQESNIFVIGNGGSAACATHWVCDFNKGINIEGKKRARMVSLSDNTGILTAIGNDISYDDIFSYQLENFCKSGDLLIALSVSGNSKNLIKGIETARTLGCTTVAIIGGYSGKIGNLADFTLVVPSENYGIVEDVHLIINHIFSQFILKLNQEV